MKPTDRVRATLIHATAPWTVRYGAALRFAGRDLPRPRRRRLATRQGEVTGWEYDAPGRAPGTGPVHVHLHGGAWLMRHPAMDDWWCRYLAATAGVRVVNVDFRTAPQVAYPVAQHQCHDAAAALAREGPVTVGGFSSGGGLAAAVCLQARDEDTFRPRLQVLGVPALDVAGEIPRARGTISPSLRDLVRRVYFPDPTTRSEPYASPLLAPDLRGLPPAVVLTGEHDTMRRDGDRYAARLREAGVPVWHDVTPGVGHYFLTEDPVRARQTMREVAGRVAGASA